MNKKNWIFKSYKYFLVFMMTLFIIVESLVLFAFYYSNRIQAVNIGQRTIFEAEQVINPIFAENERLIFFLEEYVEGMLEKGDSPKQIEVALSEIATDYRRDIDSNFFGVFGVIDGEYINSEPFEPDSEYNPENRRWYKAAIEADGHIGVTNPYSDLQTDEVVISFAKVISGGRGVIAIDIWLNDVIDMTKKLSTEGIEAIYITDSEGNIIFHSMLEFLGKNYDKTAANEEEKNLSQLFDVSL